MRSRTVAGLVAASVLLAASLWATLDRTVTPPTSAPLAQAGTTATPGASPTAIVPLTVPASTATMTPWIPIPTVTPTPSSPRPIRWVPETMPSATPTPTPPPTATPLPGREGDFFGIHLAYPTGSEGADVASRLLTITTGTWAPTLSVENSHVILDRHAKPIAIPIEPTDPAATAMLLAPPTPSSPLKWSPNGRDWARSLVEPDPPNGYRYSWQHVPPNSVVWSYSAATAQTRRLEGLGTVAHFTMWVPDGTAMIVSAHIPPPPAGASNTERYWIVPLADGRASALATETSRGSFGNIFHPIVFPRAPFSSDSRFIIYRTAAYYNPGGSLNPSYLYIRDLYSEATRRIELPQGIVYGEPRWADNDATIIAGCGQIDVATGVVSRTAQDPCPAPTPTPTPDPSPYGARFSPDGRYAIRTEMEVPQWLHGRSSRLILEDRATGSTRPLTTPDRGYDGVWEWMPDGQHVLFYRSARLYLDRPSQAVGLVNVITGKEILLTSGVEGNARGKLSPDGTRILVTGNSLRVYGLDGELQWKIDPSPGHRVESAQWLADSRRIVYVTTPPHYAPQV